MEAFSLFRYWSTNGGGATGPKTTTTDVKTTSTTLVNAAASETEDDEENDHGPFFDLEFSLPEVETAKNEAGFDEEDIEVDELEDEEDLKFTLMDGSSGDSISSTADVNVSVSPSDDLFFKGEFIPVASSDEPKTQQSRVSLMKSATKFRVMMLKLKKLKGESTENTETDTKEEEKKRNMTVKFNVEEVPIVSLFKRNNSSSKTPKKTRNEDEAVQDEKKFSKEAMQKYLRKVKPLYVRVSKRYGEKLKFSGQLRVKNQTPPAPATATATAPPPPLEEQNQSLEASEPPLLSSNGNIKVLKQGNLPATLRVVCKHLGKSRSGSTALVTVTTQRRDDSLLQQQDGIQSAILHCKRSFKASGDLDSSSSLSSKSGMEEGEEAVEVTK